MSGVAFFSGFLPLVVVGSFGLLGLRLVRRARDGDPADAATLVRQTALYGLLYLAMVLAASGASWMYREMVESSTRLENSGLAQALALVAIGLPVFTILLTIADRRLTSDPKERTGFIWTFYMNAALFTTLVALMIGSFQLIRDTLATGDANRIDGSDVMLVMTWGAFWLVHWSFLLRRHGVRGDSHLAVGSIIGIVILGIGNVGLFYVLFDRFYTTLTDDRILERAGPTADEWAAVFAVGAVVWLWFWLSHFEDGTRSEAWYVTVVPVGTLLGFVALISASATLLHTSLVWWVGDASANSSVRHFDQLPFLLAVAITGASAFAYHRWLIRAESERNDPTRIYDYLLMGASLIASSIGIVVVVSALTSAGSTEANDLLAGLTILATGIPTLWVIHRRTERFIVMDDAESSGQVRRSYLYAIVGLAGLTILSAGVTALEGILEDVLDGQVDMETLRDHRTAIATLALAAVALWRHLLHLQAIPEDDLPEDDLVVVDDEMLIVVDDDRPVLIPFTR